MEASNNKAHAHVYGFRQPVPYAYILEPRTLRYTYASYEAALGDVELLVSNDDGSTFTSAWSKNGGNQGAWPVERASIGVGSTASWTAYPLLKPLLKVLYGVNCDLEPQHHASLRLELEIGERDIQHPFIVDQVHVHSHHRDQLLLRRHRPG